MSTGMGSNIENRQVDFAATKQTVNSNRPIAQKRNRLSASDRKAKCEAVATDYQSGHPRLAIMLRQGLSKSQLNEILTHLFMRKKITPIDPLYELVSISTPIKALSQIEGKTVEYVRVEQAECGTILTPYLIGGANELGQ